MTTLTPQGVGSVKEAAVTQQKTAANKLTQDALMSERTGRLGADAAGVEQDSTQARSYFDIAPHASYPSNPGAEEAMRDLISLQPHFGSDKLMGERQWDPALLDYLNSKRNDVVR